MDKFFVFPLTTKSFSSLDAAGPNPTAGGSGTSNHHGGHNRGGHGNRGRGSGHNNQRGGHYNQHIRGGGHNAGHNNRGGGVNNRDQGHRLGGAHNINPFFVRQPFAQMNNYTIPRNQPHQHQQVQQQAPQHDAQPQVQVQPHSIRHIVVLDSSGNNRVTVPVVTAGQNIQVYTTAAGVVTTSSSGASVPAPQSDRSVQILNFGDALAARAAAAAAQNSVNNPVNLANIQTVSNPVITAAAQAATTSSHHHQPTTRQGLAAANRQFSVLGNGSGGPADNVAGEVVVHTSAPGPSGGGGGSGAAAAGAEPILVDSDSDDNSGW